MFWENSPSTDTPISASNLARSEKITELTAGSNGDYYCSLPGTLESRDIIRVLFPAATTSSATCRVSVDGGANYYVIKLKTTFSFLASSLENKYMVLQYNGAYWQPLMPVWGTDGTTEWCMHPSGKMEMWVKDCTITMSASTTFGTLYAYRSSSTGGVGITLPDLFASEPEVFGSLDTFSTTKAGASGYASGAGPYEAHLQYISTSSSGVTTSQSNVNFYIVGRWI